MFKIEYYVKINENGRPYIDLPEDYENNPEDRFFVMELVQYILRDSLNRRGHELTPEELKHLENTINIIGQISDEVANIIYNQMKNVGNAEFLLNNNYHVLVKTIEERNSLPMSDIQFGDKLFDRCEGLKVFVGDEENVYELTNGIENENWKLIECHENKTN